MPSSSPRSHRSACACAPAVARVPLTHTRRRGFRRTPAQCAPSQRWHLFGHPVSAVTAPTALIALPFADHVRPSGSQPFRARTLRPRRHPTSSAIRRARRAGLLPSLRQPGVTGPPRHRPERLVGLRQRLQHEIQHGRVEAAGAPYALSDWPPAGCKAPRRPSDGETSDWCERGDSNPHGVTHRILKPIRTLCQSHETRDPIGFLALLLSAPDS